MIGSNDTNVRCESHAVIVRLERDRQAAVR